MNAYATFLIGATILLLLLIYVGTAVHKTKRLVGTLLNVTHFAPLMFVHELPRSVVKNTWPSVVGVFASKPEKTATARLALLASTAMSPTKRFGNGAFVALVNVAFAKAPALLVT